MFQYCIKLAEQGSAGLCRSIRCDGLPIHFETPYEQEYYLLASDPLASIFIFERCKQAPLGPHSLQQIELVSLLAETYGMGVVWH